MDNRKSKDRAGDQQANTSADPHGHRLPDPTEVSAGEFPKSRQTRTRIMEAVIECLAASGYSATSTSDIAQQAGMTRAAMLYHFPSRMALMEAAIHYLTRKRVEMYGEAMGKIPHDDRYFDRAIDTAWEQLQSSEFAAFAELSQAARTDAQLSAVVSPALAEYDRARRAWALRLFPPGESAKPWFDLRRDIVRFLSEGLAELGELSFDTERRKLQVLEFLKVLCTEPESGTLMQKAIDRARGRKSGGRTGKTTD